MAKVIGDLPWDKMFSIYRFKRALSWRDFATSISLALFVMAIQQTSIYYEFVDWYFLVVPFFLLAIFNHVIYRAEHGRSNNFIGRVLHGVLFAMCYFILFRLNDVILNDGDGFDLKDFIAGPIAFFFIMMIFECFVAVLKRVLMLFRWQIL
jgi:hypothetical protein